MPTELRRLVFSSDELAEALTSYSRASGPVLPDGDIVHCRIIDGDELAINVKVLPDLGGEVQTVRIGSELLGSALIRFCQDRRIPVPRHAEKTLQAIGQNVAMTLTIAARTQRLPEFV